MIEAVIKLEREGFEAIVSGCFGNPGMDGIREILTIPALGPGATSPVLEWNDDLEATFSCLIDVSREVIKYDRADVLVLGCGTLSFRATQNRDAVGMPAINVLQVTLQMAELPVSSGLERWAESLSGDSVAAVDEVTARIVRRNLAQRAGNGGVQRRLGACLGSPDMRLERAERQLDRGQIGRVGRQIPPLAASRLDQVAYPQVLVG